MSGLQSVIHVREGELLIEPNEVLAASWLSCSLHAMEEQVWLVVVLNAELLVVLLIPDWIGW